MPKFNPKRWFATKKYVKEVEHHNAYLWNEVVRLTAENEALKKQNSNAQELDFPNSRVVVKKGGVRYEDIY